MWSENILSTFLPAFLILLLLLYLVVWPIIKRRRSSVKLIQAGYHHMVDLLTHPSELLAVLDYLLLRRKRWGPIFGPNEEEDRIEEKICTKALLKVSPVAAEAMRELPAKLRPPIVLCYLILRALDTIEDDTTIPPQHKIKEIAAFPSKLSVPGWTYPPNRHDDDTHKTKGRRRVVAKNVRMCHKGVTPGEKYLLQNFDSVISAFGRLEEEHRHMILNVTSKMAEGMTKFVTQPVKTLDDMSDYCYHVGGYLAHQLMITFDAMGVRPSKIFGNNNPPEIEQKIPSILNSAALFILITDTIQDIWEDLAQPIPRTIFPQQICDRHGLTRVTQLIDPVHQNKALLCVNELAIWAVRLIPYISEAVGLAGAGAAAAAAAENDWLFPGICIPGCVAMAVLAKCYNNLEVLSSEVQIRIGEAVTIKSNVKNLSDVLGMYDKYLKVMVSKTPKNDPNFEMAMEALDKALEAVDMNRKKKL